MTITYEDVVKAQQTQNKVIRKTNLEFSETFSKICGANVYLKNEYEQKTGSFKIRGAYYKIKSLTDDEKNKGVVAASAGNHSQGVAFASHIENIPCTIVMPKNASPAKVAATRGYGAKVVLEGTTYDESWAYAKKISEESDSTIIHAFDDSHVIAGQGVIGLEIIEQLPDVDEIYVPIGGGGLAAGIIMAVKEKHPNVKIIGVESNAYPAMKKSLETNSLQTVNGATTIADGISVKTPGKLTFEIVKQKIDKIVTVEDSEIINAMFLLMERSKAVVEPAGAVALAYILKHNPEPGKNVVPILCGGNIDMYLLGQIVSKGLSGMGRMLKISVLLKDKPGALKELVDEISSINVNIVEVIHDRLSSEVNAGSAEVTISLETEDQNQSNELINHLRDKNIEFQVIS
ncbi:MAG: threonine ammonia-lyase [Candidatus Nitrosopelagicus sp.]|jgi:threonine dehydratase|nr:threonine ammonia-lyase [Candidatus Nitrosopelagicus sp.]MBT6646438.1 threonine ammonia-lyase [Nitrososphaerota archaeon]MBT3761388.1 threonine ammonia-lyase [Candidatus Nitrosopelagicus sp.]MBT4326985.1 threonine ammonia-lyase [Candidatus Nitrosopelagicus sp.]MBT4454428.1 threonine ammonia-lyase [Candidatus Nitrosopelagicus sp.]|tara:strand:+ start:253 stop:1461 length:1209 start_codon:yes stop_codon:yes gene_type:complete